MTLQQMANRVIQARQENDYRYVMFMEELSKRTGMPIERLEHMTFMLAMGVPL